MHVHMYISFCTLTGVDVRERVQVHHVDTEKRKVKRVFTSEGAIDCDLFINCAGQVCFITTVY